MIRREAVMQIVGYGGTALVFLMLRVGIAVIGTGTLAHAQWSTEQLREYTDDCVKACNARPTDSHKCPSACACVALDLQAQFPDYAALEREHESNPAVSQRVSGITQACRRRIFGQ
jgi:hypothetical protein